MILAAARAALRDLFAPEFRTIFFKTIGLTLLALAGLWFGLKELFDWLALPWIDALLPGFPSWAGWLSLIAAIVVGVGLAIVVALLIAPATALIAGLFLDDAAALVEQTGYPSDPAGKAVPVDRALVQSLKFFGIVIAGNLFALVLLLVPGVNIAAFFLVNGYLLGREFFEFAAMRHMPEGDARAFRRHHSVTVFLAGLLIAAFVSVPLLNLLAPLFATALMVHLFKLLSVRSPRREAASVSLGRAA